jgi:hypothetical protein
VYSSTVQRKLLIDRLMGPFKPSRFANCSHNCGDSRCDCSVEAAMGLQVKRQVSTVLYVQYEVLLLRMLFTLELRTQGLKRSYNSGVHGPFLSDSHHTSQSCYVAKMLNESVHRHHLRLPRRCLPCWAAKTLAVITACKVSGLCYARTCI